MFTSTYAYKAESDDHADEDFDSEDSDTTYDEVGFVAVSYDGSDDDGSGDGSGYGSDDGSDDDGSDDGGDDDGSDDSDEDDDGDGA
ncbi:MAG TPA: hypothetical protein VH141_33460 [Pseudonocardia sp.]|nr:hypothetical protein [Pseudonocardia sp.]